MAYLETPDLPEPRSMPNYMVGAASPLWAYFGAAAAGGVAFWWMTRWGRPVNLEALSAAAAPVVEPVLEAAADVIEAVAESPAAVTEAIAEPVAAEQPVAEIAPDLAAASDPSVDASPEPVAPVLELAPEPALGLAPEAVAEPMAEPVLDPASKPRVRKAVLPPAADEA